MKITKDYPGLILTNAVTLCEDGDDMDNTYELDGDLVSEDDIVIEICGELTVRGNYSRREYQG